MGTERDRDLDRAGLLADPVRRKLYDHVARSGRDVSRDEAARGTRIDRALAAFHLDKLVAAGFLDATYRRLTGRGGPGAGRPSKVYRRSSAELSLTIPARRYELLARMLAAALDASGTRALRSASDTARAFGEGLGEVIRASVGGRAAQERVVAATARVLAENGYEPYREGPVLRMRNCPFDAVATDHQDLVCGMNLCLMEGMVGTSGAHGMHPVLDPAPGRCCVVLELES